MSEEHVHRVRVPALDRDLQRPQTTLALLCGCGRGGSVGVGGECECVGGEYECGRRVCAGSDLILQRSLGVGLGGEQQVDHLVVAFLGRHEQWGSALSIVRWTCGIGQSIL